MYKKSHSGSFKHIDFILLDIISLELAFLFAVFFHKRIYGIDMGSVIANMAVTLLTFNVFVIFFTQVFSGVLKRGSMREAIVTLRHVCLLILLEGFYLFFVIRDETKQVQIILLLTGCLYLSFSYLIRMLYKKHFITKFPGNNQNRALLIVTSKNRVNNVIYDVAIKDHEGFSNIVLAVVDEDMTGQIIDGIEVVANYDTLLDYACYGWVDEVLLDGDESDELTRDLATRFVEMGITVHVRLKSYPELAEYKQIIERIGSYTVRTTSVNMATAGQLFIKRAMDICGGIVGCLITGVLFIFVAPCIYINSPGPIFFSQERIGKNGRKFHIYKFRSMYMDAEERKQELMRQNRVKDGMMFKLDYDPRIIGSEKGPKKGIGNFIRRFSIDEWPQFFNILKGDMSLVGTRPPTVDEWEKYDPHHRARLAAKPGLTGMWQVSGRSNITDFEEVVRLDKIYIANWSVGLDIKILFKTVLVVLGNDGSM